MSRISSDGALVARARQGDGRAAEELAGRHVATAWRAAYAITGRRDLADDAVQDGFERAFAALDRFDLRRPFGPWVNRIVANRAITLSSRTPPAVEFDETLHGGGSDPDDAARDVREALRGLDHDRRAVVVLRFVLGFSPQESAEILGVPVGTVHSRLHRALADLRRLLEVPAG
ncbi:MAG: RNA polymerase sigma factor [Thermoleophilia bacterium]